MAASLGKWLVAVVSDVRAMSGRLFLRKTFFDTPARRLWLVKKKRQRKSEREGIKKHT
jgi:hypothetical protein